MKTARTVWCGLLPLGQSGIGAVDIPNDVKIKRAGVYYAAVEYTAYELEMVKRLHGHDVPDASAEARIGVGVEVFQPRLPSAARQLPSLWVG